MAIKIDCPRCKTHLQVPSRQAGGYIKCVHCQGRLWVPKDAPTDATQADSVTASAVGGTSPVVLASPPTRPAPAAASAPAAPLAPVAKAPVPLPQKKVARFITAEAADSTLRLAADGKLPQLHLEEGPTPQKTETTARSINPLVLLGLLSMSVVMSVVLVLVDWEAPSVSDALQKAQVRQMIEDEYFGAGAFEVNRRLEPYQLLLREAQRAYSRGDYKTQRQQYRKVLDLLRAERGPEEKGLTGSRLRDEKLMDAISTLLSGE